MDALQQFPMLRSHGIESTEQVVLNQVPSPRRSRATSWEEDLEEAACWFRAAADAGNPDGSFGLGTTYADLLANMDTVARASHT